MLWVPYPPPSIYTLRYRLFHISLKVSDQKKILEILERFDKQLCGRELEKVITINSKIT